MCVHRFQVASSHCKGRIWERVLIGLAEVLLYYTYALHTIQQ